MRWTILPALAGAFCLATTVAQAGDDWNGFYAGLSAGLASINDELQGYPGMHGPWEPWSGGDNSGLVGGAQAGVNHQMNQVVLGLEALVLLPDIDGTALSGNGRPPTRYQANWLASIGPRVGYAVGDALLYAKGGFGIADLDYTHSSSTGENTAYGFTLGGGVEYAFSPALSGRVDYTYFGFGTDTTTLYQSNGAAQTMVKHDPDAHVVTVGLNYHF